MSSKKRLGKSLDDISHFFLSRSAPLPSSKVVKPSDRQPEHSALPQTKIWLTVSLVPKLPSAFLAANLSVEWARGGRRVLTIETAPPPSLDEVFGTVPIRPSLCDLLEQPQKQLTIEGPLGIKILSFRLRPEELRTFSPEEQEILLQILRKEEEASDLMVVDVDGQDHSLFREWARVGQGVILAADLRPENVLPTYQVCKYLYHARSDMHIGLVAFGNRERDDGAAGMKKLRDAAARFLGKSLEGCGTIPEDPLIERSLGAKIPLTFLEPTSRIASDLASIAAHLQSARKRDLNETVPIGSFFESL
ncbi:MAG: hypothetical protein HY204_10490 [Nitrospirae bacterium]|nr:hypothetical protein [Nitrospirota bacterium]